MLLIGTFNMYDYIHEPAEYLKTCLDGEDWQHILSLSFDKRKAIINDWKRIDQLIFKSRDNREQNQ